jgi:5-methylcytosine-specific restriction endonuclease McrBC regulatory subunit McrC
MHTGKITDNTSGLLTAVFRDCPIQDHQELKEKLKRFLDVPLSQLVEQNKGLLIFPSVLNDHDDGIGKASICTLQGDTLNTGNILGFIGYGNVRLSITSRFDQGGSDFFLHYMLQKVLSLNVFDLKAGRADDEVWDFFLYFFPHYLKRAISQGLYREYQHRVFNDSNVRGTIDVARHLRLNVPFAGKVAYRTREYLNDNRMTQLIRHTIEFIKTKDHARGILSANQDIRDAVEEIVAVTPTYAKSQRMKIIATNLRNVSHPYYTEYLPLQKLCLQILRHEKLSYGDEEDVIYGILFDGAWLWEEYLAVMLREIDPEVRHPRNKTGQGRDCIFEDGQEIYPDFIKMKDKLTAHYVADAKYKRIDTRGEKTLRDDYFQVLTYMYRYECNQSCILFPCDGEDNKEVERERRVKGNTPNRCIWELGLPIPDTRSARDFKLFVANMDKNAKEVLSKMVNKLSCCSTK